MGIWNKLLDSISSMNIVLTETTFLGSVVSNLYSIRGRVSGRTCNSFTNCQENQRILNLSESELEFKCRCCLSVLLFSLFSSCWSREDLSLKSKATLASNQCGQSRSYSLMSYKAHSLVPSHESSFHICPPVIYVLL